MDEPLSGVKKAAILLLTIDEELSKEVIKDLDEEDLKKLNREIEKIKIIPEQIVNKVHEEFFQSLQKTAKPLLGGSQKFKELLKKTLGEEKAEIIVLGKEQPKQPGDFLKRCDPRALSNVLRNEHPQTIALVLSVIGPKKASEVLILLPEKLRADVMIRMAYLEKVDKKILAEIENVLRDELESIGVVEGKRLGGIEVVAGILNQMDRRYETEILEKIEEANSELAERIRQLMFTFDDILKLDDRSIQVLLKEISSEDLTLALKGASEAIKAKIFSNMSERAAAMLKEDLEAMGPVRVSDVEKAQIKIAMTVKRLDEEGKIVLARENEELI